MALFLLDSINEMLSADFKQEIGQKSSLVTLRTATMAIVRAYYYVPGVAKLHWLLRIVVFVGSLAAGKIRLKGEK